jgi:hypothetical protein
MKTLIYTAPLLITLSLSALAQTSNGSRAQGYLFIAPGVGTADYGRDLSGAFVHIGGGGERLIYKGIGLGAEIGAVIFGGYSFGAGSVNVSYHFLPNVAERKLEPFVSLGYGPLFRAGVAYGFNPGLGFNRWLNKNYALRFEVRYNSARHNGYGNLIGFRLGVTLK